MDAGSRSHKVLSVVVSSTCLHVAMHTFGGCGFVHAACLAGQHSKRILVLKVFGMSV